MTYRVWLSVIGLMFLAGCGQGASQIVRTRHAAQFQCPKKDVKVTALGGDAWLADGCGQRITYVCKDPNKNALSTGDASCVMESVAKDGEVTKPK